MQKKDASDSEINKSLDYAKTRDFLGEDALCDNMTRGGVNFSGGQRQRLSIARALTRDASVYIFDDSFSALDYKTDYELRMSLKDFISNKIVIIVAQRVATILNADKILVLEDGEVAGYGTHEDLMKNNEVYREIAISQGQDYEE